MALMAEMNRDRKRRRKPFKPDDFNPYAEQSRSLLKARLNKQHPCWELLNEKHSSLTPQVSSHYPKSEPEEPTSS